MNTEFKTVIIQQINNGCVVSTKLYLENEYTNHFCAKDIEEAFKIVKEFLNEKEEE